jgi:hypothetical protein
MVQDVWSYTGAFASSPERARKELVMINMHNIISAYVDAELQTIITLRNGATILVPQGTGFLPNHNQLSYQLLGGGGGEGMFRLDDVIEVAPHVGGFETRITLRNNAEFLFHRNIHWTISGDYISPELPIPIEG